MNQIIAALLIAAAGAFGGWTAQGWHLGEKIEALKAGHAQKVADAVRASNQALINMVNDRDAKAELLAAIDLKFTKQLTKARNETNRLNSCIAAGTCGLRVAATCPARDTQAASAAEGGRVDSGAGAVLDPSAQQAYRALRDGIDRTEGKLAACQGSLVVFTSSSPAHASAREDR